MCDPAAMHADTLRLGCLAVLVAAVVCPHPPLLIPQVAAGAASELDDLRDACRTAISEMLETVDRVVVLGVGASLRSRRAGGTMRRYGVDLQVGEAGDESLPLSLTIGAWLLEQAASTVPREYVGLSERADIGSSAQALTEAADGAARVGALVMADLSAKLTTAAPGYLDERAAPFDRSVVRALSTVDVETLRSLDIDLAEELWCYDVVVLAALAAAWTHDSAAVTARIHHDAAPYGVGYVVSSWLTS